MEGNEMNVFAQTHCSDNEKEDGTSDNISRHNKGGFRHFVEESTLRNVNLDELEELSVSDGCPSDIQGTNRRTPSIASSEPPVRFAVILEWHRRYFFSGEGMLRFAFLVCVYLKSAVKKVSGNCLNFFLTTYLYVQNIS